MAELHVVGEISGGRGFAASNLFCKWGLYAGTNFDLLEGNNDGQTHVDNCRSDEDSTWSHPIDVHYSLKGLSGWPKIFLQVWSQDELGRTDLRGYGFCQIPTSPGIFSIDCTTWLPTGTLAEQIKSFFIGGTPRLKIEEIVYSSSDRFRLCTVSSGIVNLRFNLVFKDFGKHNVNYG